MLLFSNKSTCFWKVSPKVEIKLNKQLLGELLVQLGIPDGLSLRDMSQILHINKDKLNKILNDCLL